jgi:hypothetical protein
VSSTILDIGRGKVETLRKGAVTRRQAAGSGRSTDLAAVRLKASHDDCGRLSDGGPGAFGSSRGLRREGVSLCTRVLAGGVKNCFTAPPGPTTQEGRGGVRQMLKTVGSGTVTRGGCTRRHNGEKLSGSASLRKNTEKSCVRCRLFGTQDIVAA